MAEIIINGKPANTTGSLPAVGDKAPGFVLTKTDLSGISLNDLKGKNVILNIFPSIDTPVCSTSVRRFNTEVANLPNTAVLCVSMDLPFAHARFCTTEGISGVIPVSKMGDNSFGEDYGVMIADGMLKGLFARAVVAVNDEGIVIYSKFARDLSEEPDYNEVLTVFKKNDTGKTSLNICSGPMNAESARFDDPNEPCDDGRGGN